MADQNNGRVVKKDKLSYFDSGLNDEYTTSEEEDETEEVTNTQTQKDASYISKSTKSAELTNSLPSAAKLLDTKTDLTFLKKPVDLSMDQLAKNTLVEKELEQEREYANKNTHTVPPPRSYDSQTAKLKPTLGDTTILMDKRPLDTEGRAAIFVLLLILLFCGW